MAQVIKLKSYSSYNHPVVKKSKTGTGKVANFEYKVDSKTGRLKKIYVGVTDVYKLIQENAKLCGLDLLISQIKSGDLSGLDSSGGLYANAKDLPKTIHDVHDLTIKASKVYANNKILQKLYKTPDAYLNDLLDNKVEAKVNNFYNVEKSRLDAEIKKAREDAKVIKNVDNPKKEEVHLEPKKENIEVL